MKVIEKEYALPVCSDKQTAWHTLFL